MFIRRTAQDSRWVTLLLCLLGIRTGYVPFLVTPKARYFIDKALERLAADIENERTPPEEEFDLNHAGFIDAVRSELAKLP